MLTSRDDLRHRLRQEAHARESLFYGTVLPEPGLMVFLYTWVSGDDLAGALATVVDGDGTRLLSATDGIPAGGADFDDWAVGGLTLRHAPLMERAELRFAEGENLIELAFEGAHAPFSYLDNEDPCPSFVADDRFEQTCRVTGRIVVDGEEVPVDSHGHRDHSWGTRDWSAIQDWKWCSGWTTDGAASFNVMLMHGRGTTTTHGYVLREGTLTPVRRVRADVRYDEDFLQTDADLVVEDADGGRLTVTAERFALFAFDAGTASLREAGCAGTIDGAPAAVHLECGWDRAYAERQVAASPATA